MPAHRTARPTAISIDLYADAGIEWVGLSDQRPKDKFGVAAGYARVSPWARALDVDFQRSNGPSWPTRSFESLVTVVYQYEVRAGWTLQPNFQYITHPGGGATDPLGTKSGQSLEGCSCVRSPDRIEVLNGVSRSWGMH